MLKEQGVEVFLHTVIGGGDLYEETLKGLLSVLEIFPDLPAVIWLNQFGGKIEASYGDCEKTPLFKQYAARILALVRLPRRNETTFGADIRRMKSNRKKIRILLS